MVGRYTHQCVGVSFCVTALTTAISTALSPVRAVARIAQPVQVLPLARQRAAPVLVLVPGLPEAGRCTGRWVGRFSRVVAVAS